MKTLMKAVLELFILGLIVWFLMADNTLTAIKLGFVILLLSYYLEG